MIRIGYMGIPLSNSEKAAELMIQRMDDDVELVPLIDSESVTKALLSGDIDYGVVAVRNMVAGPVVETEEALRNSPSIVSVTEISLPIHHCIFVKHEGAEIDSIASHIQALGQTYNNVEHMFPWIRRVGVADTALAAEMLSDGRLPETTAVLCTMAAGMHYKLHLLEENVEDDPENWTDFALLKKD